MANANSARQQARRDYEWQIRQQMRMQRREQEWSARQARHAERFSAQQARQQMAFQERMSSTAHQREMADLQAAGLNPVLAAGSGGASAPSGSAAAGEQPSYVSSIVDSMPQLFAMMQDTINSARQAQRTTGYVIKKKIEGDEQKEEQTGDGKEKGNDWFKDPALDSGAHPDTSDPYYAKLEQMNHPDAMSNREIVQSAAVTSKELFKDLQKKVGDLRTYIRGNNRGVGVSVGGSLKQIGNIAEDIYYMGENLKGHAGVIIKNTSDRIIEGVRAAADAHSAKARNRIMNQMLDEAEYARYLLNR